MLALLPEEPAGRISTRNAGTISFLATLSWRPEEGGLAGAILDEPTPSARFYSLVQTDHLESATREISCEIRALYTEDLATALNGVLRSVTAHAALTDAMLETRAVRLADPSEAHPTLVEKLARELSVCGLRASFGPSWTPARGAEVSVGTRGSEGVLERFLCTHSDWWVRLDRRPSSG